jgi:hypothetical protein
MLIISVKVKIIHAADIHEIFRGRQVFGVVTVHNDFPIGMGHPSLVHPDTKQQRDGPLLGLLA